MNKRNELPSLAVLAYLFALDVDTGVLTRRVTRAPNARAGDVVGSVDGKGYLHVNICGTLHRVHRIVYLMHFGEEPSHIDHRNGVRTDNRPCNLRAADDQRNAGNTGLNRNNTSGFRGVSRNSRSGKYHAQIKLHGRQTYLGRFDTPEEASARYAEAARKHFGDFVRDFSDA